MPLSRRNLLRNLSAGAIVGAVAPALRGFPLAPATEAALWGNSAPAPRPGAAAAAEPILLYRNENPYGASEKVISVLRESAAAGNRYPRTEYDTLLDKLTAQHNIKRDQIVLGCGSGEILCMAAMAFLKPGKKLVQAAPTFPALGKLAQTAGIDVADVPLNAKYAHDLPTMLDRAGSSAGLVYVVNPNNPTASLTPRRDIEAFLSKLPTNVPVLIDEAYHHFATPGEAYASFLDRPIGDPRLIVARTFSKIYGLAGMRIGYAVATPEMIKRISAGFPGWSVSIISARAASAALDDVDYVRFGIKRNAADRQQFITQARARKLDPVDSQANFVMFDPRRSPDAVIKHLKEHNILIGPKYPALASYVRVSLGTPPEMQEFWRIWDLLPPADKV
jgi:histidinol-phosphate aminotransferase